MTRYERAASPGTLAGHGAKVVERADVRVAERRDDTRFAFERWRRSASAENPSGSTYGDRAVQARVACLVDFAHPAAGCVVEDLVRAEPRAEDQRRISLRPQSILAHTSGRSPSKARCARSCSLPAPAPKT